MRVFQAHLDNAPIADVFVYRTQVFCWTFEKKLRIYQVKDIEQAIVAADPDNGEAVNYALFHSRGRGAPPRAVSAWRQVWERGTEVSSITVDAETVPYTTHHPNVSSVDVLDMLLFYGRIYLASGSALFSIEPFEGTHPPSRLKLDARVKQTCYGVSGGLAAVSASCAERGLFVLFDDRAGSRSNRKPHRASPVSLRAEIGFGSVANHRSRTEVEILAGGVTEEKGYRILTDVRPATGERNTLAKVLEPSVDAELSLWDSSRLVVFRDGQISSVAISREGDVRRATNTREIGVYGAEVRVISVARVGTHFAVETDDTIIVAGDGEAIPIETGPVVSMRAYPHSIRYRRLLTATTERGVSLFGISRTIDPDEFG